MKKWILALFATVLFAPVAGHAQNDMLFHIKAGINLANVTIEDVTEDPAPSASAVLGGIGGIGFTAGLAENFGIRAEMLYSMKGTEMDAIEGTGITIPGQKLTINYIDIPVTAVVKFPATGFTPSLFAGPVFSVKMGDASVTVNDEKVDLGGEDDGIEGFDMGVTFGAGVGFGMGDNEFGIDARYTLGLTNIIEDDDADNDPFPGGEYKHNVISVMLSYTFDLAR